MDTLDRTMPLVVYANEEQAEPSRFADGVRALADSLGPAGVILVASQAVDDGSSAVILDVDVSHPASAAAFPLAERAAELLQHEGLTTDFGSATSPPAEPWTALRAALAGATYPVAEVRLPARLGRRGGILTARALQPLRQEHVLVVAIPRPRRAIAAADEDLVAHDPQLSAYA